MAKRTCETCAHFVPSVSGRTMPREATFLEDVGDAKHQQIQYGTCHGTTPFPDPHTMFPVDLHDGFPRVVACNSCRHHETAEEYEARTVRETKKPAAKVKAEAS